MIQTPYILTDPNGANRIKLNATFYLQTHTSEWRLSPVSIPRSHSSRVQEVAYMQGKNIELIGVVGSGSGIGLRGALPFGAEATTDVQFFDQLQSLLSKLHRQTGAILDYRNGLIQYVRYQGLVSRQQEGWPEEREVTIRLFAEDPLAYQLAKADLTYGGYAVTGTVGGTLETKNWRLRIRAEVAQTVEVALTDSSGTKSLFLDVPLAPATLIVNGYQRTLYTTTIDSPEWSRFKPNSVFWSIAPGPCTWNFLASDGGALSVKQFDVVGAKDLEVELSCHAAHWLADSVQVPSNLPPGEYDYAEYDVDTYA